MHVVLKAATAVAAISTILLLNPFPGSAASTNEPNAPALKRRGTLAARVIATGIPGAGAVTEVGDFLRGSPLHDNAALSPFAAAGKVLDAKRILVASTSNFGAPLARAKDPEGAVISIDPSQVGSVVPAGFAASGAQPSALDGKVQLYTAQSPAFLNKVTAPNAVTADQVAASLPMAISLNNGNGRPWVANAPNGAAGIGTISVLDPQGYPLAGAPSTTAGGIFAGDLTNRNAASTKGLTTAALGTAILTKSPDLTGRAVFAVVEADGSVVQVNVLKGVDGLAPAGTVTPVKTIDRAAAESTDPNVITREGMVFNWVPGQNLFIADPQANRIVVLDLTDDGVMFHAKTRELRAKEFNVPIDMAPATREISSGSFSSNTTLGGGSDIYVLNRGDNSIVRMSVSGAVMAVRTVESELGAFRLNGIGVSSDGQTIYLTATTPDGGGALLAVDAFGATAATDQIFFQAKSTGQANDMTAFSGYLFSLKLTPAQGLGPLFNDMSCAGCHSSPAAGGMGLLSTQDVKRVGRSGGALAHGGPVARTHSVSELGVPCDVPPGLPANADLVSTRTAVSLRGAGLLDVIALGDVMANMALQPEAVRGRPNLLADGRMGKFGWKADVPTLVEFMGEAFRNEMGVTNPLEPKDELNGCGANRHSPEVDGLILQGAAKFLNTLDPPAPTAACLALPGAATFGASCASCHTPSMPGPGARQALAVYTDLLLHDMGPGLADGMVQGAAQGSEWRTPPLWRVSERGKFLHDGRAKSLAEAIAAHGGQGQAAADAFAGLDAAGKQALLAYLGCI